MAAQASATPPAAITNSIDATPIAAAPCPPSKAPIGAGATVSGPARQAQEAAEARTEAKGDPTDSLGSINSLYLHAVRIFRAKKPIVAAVQGAAIDRRKPLRRRESRRPEPRIEHRPAILPRWQTEINAPRELNMHVHARKIQGGRPTPRATPYK